MKDIGDFLVLRYSLVEESQQVLEVSPLPIPKGSAVSIAIYGDREYTHNKSQYAFVGFSEVNPTPPYEFQSSRYVVGKVAKLRKAKFGEKVPGNIIKHLEDDWIPLVTIFDLQEQYIFVQKHWKFGVETLITNAIQAGLREPILSKYNHRVFVEAKTRKSDFWSVVNSHKKIYRFELNLISPNILKTNEKARDALKDLKELYGQDEMSMILENESGSLNIPKEPIADYIDYTAEGEGRWALVTEGERGGKKKHTSDRAALSVELPIPSEEEIYNQGQLELETGAPAPGRDLIDASLVAEVTLETEKLDRNTEND